MSRFLHSNILLRLATLAGCIALLACTASETTSQMNQPVDRPLKTSKLPVDAVEARQRLLTFIDGVRKPEDLAPSSLERAFDMGLVRVDGSTLRGERLLGQGQWVVTVRSDNQNHEVVVRYPKGIGADGCTLSIGQFVSSLRERGFEVLLSDAIDRPKVWSFPGMTRTGHRLSILAMTTPESATREDLAPCVHRVDISMEMHDG